MNVKNATICIHLHCTDCKAVQNKALPWNMEALPIYSSARPLLASRIELFELGGVC